MSEQVKVSNPNPNPNEAQRARLINDVRRLLFEGMKKAEQSQNWELFSRYADAYRNVAG